MLSVYVIQNDGFLLVLHTTRLWSATLIDWLLTLDHNNSILEEQ